MNVDIRESVLLNWNDDSLSVYHNEEILSMFDDLQEFSSKDIYNDSPMNFGKSTLEQDTQFYNRKEKLQNLELIMSIVKIIGKCLKSKKNIERRHSNLLVLTIALKNALNEYRYIDNYGYLRIKNRKKRLTLYLGYSKLLKVNEYGLTYRQLKTLLTKIIEA